MRPTKKIICCCRLRGRTGAMALPRRVMVEVVKVHNSTMLVARVLETNSLLRFRFMHPLDVKVVVPGCLITISKCQFSLVTKMINCLSVEQNVFRAKRRGESVTEP